MAVLQMQRVSICALKKDRKSILERLQSMGVMEVSQVLEDESGFEKQDTQGTRILFEKKASSADQALEILQEYAPEKTSFLSSLEGKALIEKEKYAESISKKEDIMNVVSDLVGWQLQVFLHVSLYHTDIHQSWTVDVLSEAPLQMILPA